MNSSSSLSTAIKWAFQWQYPSFIVVNEFLKLQAENGGQAKSAETRFRLRAHPEAEHLDRSHHDTKLFYATLLCRRASIFMLRVTHNVLIEN
jgi:hypothetical protein